MVNIESVVLPPDVVRQWGTATRLIRKTTPCYVWRSFSPALCKLSVARILFVRRLLRRSELRLITLSGEIHFAVW
jgi:hypothetical protein